MSPRCAVDSITSYVSQRGGNPCPAAQPSRTRWRQCGSAYASRRSSTDRGMSSAKTGDVLSVKGSCIVIENDSGRQETCGHTSAPSARNFRWMSRAFRWAPVFVVRSAVYVTGPPTRCCSS